MPYSEDIRSPGAKESTPRVKRLSDSVENYVTNSQIQKALVLANSLHPVSEEEEPHSPQKARDGPKRPAPQPSRSSGKAGESVVSSSKDERDKTNVETGERTRVGRVKKCCSFKHYYVAINCLVLIGGVVLLLLSLWLMMHYSAMLAAVGNNTSVVTVIVLVLNGLHLVCAGVSGICGAFKRGYIVLLNLGLCALISAILLTNTFLQLSYQDTVESEAEVYLSESLSRAIRYIPADQKTWDTFHISLGCCGIRSFADWCSELLQSDGTSSSTEDVYKEEEEAGRVRYKKHRSRHMPQPEVDSEADYDEQRACLIPESCCVRNRQGLLDPHCMSAPTLHNTYTAGCLTHIVAIIAVTGHVFRALCIGMSIVALSAAILAMFMVACVRG